MNVNNVNAARKVFGSTNLRKKILNKRTNLVRKVAIHPKNSANLPGYFKRKTVKLTNDDYKRQFLLHLLQHANKYANTMNTYEDIKSTSLNTNKKKKVLDDAMNHGLINRNAMTTDKGRNYLKKYSGAIYTGVNGNLIVF